MTCTVSLAQYAVLRNCRARFPERSLALVPYVLFSTDVRSFNFLFIRSVNKFTFFESEADNSQDLEEDQEAAASVEAALEEADHVAAASAEEDSPIPMHPDVVRICSQELLFLLRKQLKAVREASK